MFLRIFRYNNRHCQGNVSRNKEKKDNNFNNKTFKGLLVSISRGGQLHGA